MTRAFIRLDRVLRAGALWLGVCATAAAGVLAVPSPASADPLPVGVRVTTLPFFGQGLRDGSGTGSPGSTSGNALVSQKCNSGTPIFAPQWWTLPAADLGSLLVKATAVGGTGGHSSGDWGAGNAVVDTNTGVVVACNATSVTLTATQSLSVVVYFPSSVDPCQDVGVGCWNDEVQLYVNKKPNAAPANTSWMTATPISSLPYAQSLDITLSGGAPNPLIDDYGCLLSFVNPVEAGTVWWRYTPTVDQLEPSLAVDSDIPGFRPSISIAHLTPDGPVAAYTADAADCQQTRIPIALHAGETYVIGVFDSYDSYWDTPSQVPGGPIALRVGNVAVPRVPLGVAVATDPDAKTITLTWSAPASDGTSPITGYRVSRDGNDSGSTGAYSTIVSADTRSFTFSFLNPWDVYSVSVQALNASGGGMPATRVAALVGAAPSAPLSVTASPGNGSATVAWTRPVESGASAITGYRIRRFVGTSGLVASTTTVPATATSFVATELTNGTGYTFDVAAVNASGAGRGARTSVVTPVGAPSAPAAVSVSSDGVAKTAAITWSAPPSNGGSPITGYRVSRDGFDSGSTGAFSTVLPATASSFTFAFLNPWDTYSLSVQAINAVGMGPASKGSTTISAPTASAPTAITASPGNAQASLGWGAPAHAGSSPVTGYRIRRFATGSATVQATVTVPAAARTYVATGLTNGVSYRFDIAAVNSSGAGRVAATSSVVPVTVPGAPASVSVAADTTAGTATITWTPPRSNGGSTITGYRVARDGHDSGSTGAYSTVVPATARSFTFAFLNAWDTYHLSVQAINGVGAGSLSTGTVTLVVPTPSAPVGLAAAAGNARASLTWSPPLQAGSSAITGYQIRTYVGSTLRSATTIGASQRSFVAGGLVNGTAYTFTVTATNASGGGRSTRTGLVTPHS